MFAKGLPRNLGDPHVSTSVSEGRGLRHRRQYRRGAGNSDSPLPRVRSSPWYRSSERKRERSGMGGGSRSTPIVPLKPANRRPREPVEERGVPGYGAAERKHAETLCSPCVSTKRLRIAIRAALCSESVTRGAGCGNPARPDLQGGRGEQSLRSTRPHASNSNAATAAPLLLRHVGPGRAAQRGCR